MKTIRLTDNLSILTKEDGYVDFATIGNDWFELSDDEESCITVHWSELANIPQVKALIDALQEMVEFEGPHLGVAFDYEIMMDDSYNALAPFKKSAGDKQCTN